MDCKSCRMSVDRWRSASTIVYDGEKFHKVAYIESSENGPICSVCVDFMLDELNKGAFDLLKNPRIEKALRIASEYGTIDGSHHKMWVIDQMVRALTGCEEKIVHAKDIHESSYSYSVMIPSQEYSEFREDFEDEWNEGTAP